MLNELVRRFHLVIFLPLLRLLLPPRTSVRPRNSVLTPKYFSALWSDVDIAIITDETNEEKLAALHGTLRRIRSCYPWLGEAEIYNDASWTRLGALKQELAPTYETARMIRKRFWFKDQAQAKGLTLYKHKRFLRILREKLPKRDTLPEVIHAGFLEVIDPCDETSRELTYYHDYFQCVISTHPTPENPLPFQPKEALALARSFPVARTTHHELSLDGYTAKGRLIIEVEILEVTGAFAGHPKPDWYGPWLETLRSYLKGPHFLR